MADKPNCDACGKSTKWLEARRDTYECSRVDCSSRRQAPEIKVYYGGPFVCDVDWNFKKVPTTKEAGE